MNIQINKLAAGAIDQTMMVAETVVALSRSAAESTAQVIQMAKTPVRNVARTCIKINDITHKGITRLVKVQAKAIERSVEAGAARLELAARAPSVRDLVKTQLELLPHTRARLKGDLRDTWTVVTETGSEFGALFSWNQPEMKGTPTSKRKSKAKTTRKPRAKKAAASKKPATRKPASSSKATRKGKAGRRQAA